MNINDIFNCFETSLCIDIFHYACTYIPLHISNLLYLTTLTDSISLLLASPISTCSLLASDLSSGRVDFRATYTHNINHICMYMASNNIKIMSQSLHKPYLSSCSSLLSPLHLYALTNPAAVRHYSPIFCCVAHGSPRAPPFHMHIITLHEGRDLPPGMLPRGVPTLLGHQHLAVSHL